LSFRDQLRIAALPAVGAAATVVAVSWVTTASGSAFVQFTAIAILVVLLLSLPRELLPALALILFCFVPVAYMAVPQIVGRYFTPAVIALAVWAVRQVVSEGALQHARRGKWIALSALLALCLVIGSALSVNPPRSWTWSLTLLLCVALVAVVALGNLGSAAPHLYRAWEWVAIVLGAFAILEFVAGSNPAAELYYSAQDLASGTSNWNSYRVRTMLGHPLMNALVFGPSAALLLIRFFENGRRLSLVGGLFMTVALILTGSRGGLLGFGAGLVLGVVVLVFQRQVRLGLKVISAIALPALMIAAYFSPLIQERFETGQASAGQRFDVLEVARILVAEDGLWGYGPGTAQTALSSRGVDLLLESSAIQAVLGLGLFTALVLGALIVFVVVRSIKLQRAAPPAAIVAYLVCASTFNIWDQYPGSLALLGLLVILGIGQESVRQPSDEMPTIQFRAADSARSVHRKG
jgi:O-antigen ligase